MQVFINDAAYNKLKSFDCQPNECGFFHASEQIIVAWKVDDEGNFDTIETDSLSAAFRFFKGLSI